MRPRIIPPNNAIVPAIAAASLLLVNFCHAQTATPASAWPFGSPSATPIDADQPPARDIPLVEKPWDQLSNKEVGEDGEKALQIKPERWKHAETDNFIIHYRRATEAHKVVREIEYDLWFVAKTLGATPAQYRRKSHVFVFEDENEWKIFLANTSAPSWAGSFAYRDELFLSVRHMESGGQFDSHTLAHETTHAVVARLYPFEHWPVWLNEGFAEYMGSASVAARNHIFLKNAERNLGNAGMPLDEMFGLRHYPEDEDKVAQLYQTGEKFVRFLMTELPKERFRQFVTALLASNNTPPSDDVTAPVDKTAAGANVEKVFMSVYGDKFKTFDAFQKKFATFSK